MSDLAISMEGVSKAYERNTVRRRDLKGSLSAWRYAFGRNKEEFLALQDIHLNIAHGDVVGIVGLNGAGKSTLLKLLSRITFPTHGRITIYGTLSSMLEIGTGFHPELTGRENIFLNGAIIGMKRAEVNRKLESIVDFSGLEDFLDTPIKHYSSGMYVRLAFAVASHLEPDILLIDEVLAVGDLEFKKKSMDKLMDVARQGRTIVVVSHQMSYLKDFCRTGVFLDSGQIRYTGSMDETIHQYVSHFEQHQPATLTERTDRRGNGRVKLTGFQLLNAGGRFTGEIPAGDPVTIKIRIQAQEPEVLNVDVQIGFYDLYGQACFMINMAMVGKEINSLRGEKYMECHIPKLPLNTQHYFVNVTVTESRHIADEIKNLVSFEVVPGKFYATGELPLTNIGFLVDYTWTEG